ncbi:MAG: endonuclease/exonuclease/phosphatase family protein [Bacilli bacterium]
MSKKKKFRPLRFILGTIFILLGVVVLVLGSYVGYISLTYYRIGDIHLQVLNNQTTKIAAGDIGTKEFKITTYNVGFGAYDRDYSFFMDVSEFKQEYIESQGNKDNTGDRAHGASKAQVITNITGAYDTIVNLGDLDFMLYQEVDTKSTRSYKIDQYSIGNEKHVDYGKFIGLNYHSAYLAYPFHEPIGQSNSGITTYSKYKIDSAERREFKITDSFFGKFFDLDRCFTTSEIPIEDSVQKLYIFNVHMSAYDAAGIIRKVQLEQLKAAITVARDYDGNNNYVVVGGDFNHDLVIDNPLVNEEYKDNIFNKQETAILTTDWYNYLRLDPSKHGTRAVNLISGMEEDYVYDFKDMHLTSHGPVNIGTCRDASIPFVDKNNNGIVDNAMVSIDGFLVSDNISVTEIKTIGSGAGLQTETLPASDPRYGLGFVYSDHNPVFMSFKLLV